MSDLKPTDPQYIEAAKNIYCREDKNERSGFDAGYKLALEHTNHAELVEAVHNVITKFYNQSLAWQDMAVLKQIFDKSETSKLK